MISIHVPLLKETHHLINKDTIAKMMKNVIIINTSRGEVVHTPDLVQGLEEGKIFGAALDVFEGEKAFIFKDNHKTGFGNLPELDALSKMHNVIISSHVAFYTDESIRQVGGETNVSLKWPLKH
jgi:D-lactate dehydrogenase